MQRTPADLRDLEILDRWQKRQRASTIAKALDTTEHAVKQRLREIIRADLKHDPDAKGYWRPIWEK